jgi:hypothetical protein
MRRLTVSLAALSLALLAGCGGKAADGAAGTAKRDAATGTPDTGDANSAEVKAENMIADCMKGKGFRYVPHPLSFDDDNQVAKYAGLSSLLEPVDQVRAFRAKYGFGAYARLVFPNDPAVAVRQVDPNQNPNNAIRAALDPAQQKAYDKALTGDSDGLTVKEAKTKSADQGCAGEASLKYYGSGPSKDEQAAAGREYAKFQNDPAVISAAQKYADCLKNKGYRVSSAQPGRVEESMFDDATAKAENAGAVSAAAAKSGLTTEIKAALDDLDCRAGYATLARTKYAAAVKAGNGVG